MLKDNGMPSSKKNCMLFATCIKYSYTTQTNEMYNFLN